MGKLERSVKNEQYAEESKRITRRVMLGMTAGLAVGVGPMIYCFFSEPRLPEEILRTRDDAKKTLTFLEREIAKITDKLPYSPNKEFSRRWSDYVGDNRENAKNLDSLIADVKTDISRIESDPAYVELQRFRDGSNLKIWGGIGSMFLFAVLSTIYDTFARGRAKERIYGQGSRNDLYLKQ